MPRYHLYMRHYDNKILLSTSECLALCENVEEVREQIHNIALYNNHYADCLIIERISVEYSEDTNGKI